ncbi:unnamed protein product [Microthlaspi erraticum]|uniref:F-box domain-containing protein n=1 Tax=Microthlaspi erraticum TaxID=1685480 RepID=A0A6D2JYJ3_9BRAS|nr:unnamed protein product [Microthlaspi erraticum]
MSTTAASNNNEPPRTNNEHPHSLSPSFSWLPNDTVLNILARVPRRNHPILCRVSKNFQSIVRSSALHQTRSLMGKDYLYVCFRDFGSPSLAYHWFTLDENRLVPIPLSSPPQPNSTALMVGHEIYFVGGYINNHSCKSMWILNYVSCKLRQGPSTRVARRRAAVGHVDKKIYVFGRFDHKDKDIQAEVFDTKTQTWDVAPNPNMDVQCIWMSMVNQSLDRKIYARNYKHVVAYDPRDGKCDKIYLPNNDRSCSDDVCMIDNLLYIHCSYVGLIWYDSKEKEWSVVKGLKLDVYSASEVKMAEHNGKLVFLWTRSCQEDTKWEIWCAMIALDRSGVEVMGKVEWFDHVLTVPCDYKIMHCLGRTD